MGKWKYWEVGYYGRKERWVKIMTIYARNADDARLRARKFLSRPGRANEFRIWKARGCEVLEVAR